MGWDSSALVLLQHSRAADKGEGSEGREKRSGIRGEDEDRDRVRYSARQHRLQIFIFCLLLQALWSNRPVSICVHECVGGWGGRWLRDAKMLMAEMMLSGESTAAK